MFDSIDSRLREFVKTNLSIESSLIVKEDRIVTKGKLQHISSLKCSDAQLQVRFEVLMQHSLRAESMCAGAGLVFLEMFASEGRSNKTPSRASRRRRDIVSLIETSTKSRKARSIALEVLDLCDMNTNISVKKSDSEKSYLEISEGYTFDTKSLLRSNFVYRDCRVACIDGFIESVSEIHLLLTEVGEAKQPCILVSRGMSDDVVHTLSVNLNRKTLQVHPFVVPFDIDNVNTIVDIAVISGTDVVSSTKGDLISTLGLSKTGKVSEVRCSGDVLRMKNPLTQERVRRHLVNLKNIMVERPEIEDIISKRVRSLTSKCIDIRLSEDMDYSANLSQIDFCVRAITSLLRGVYDPVSVAEKIYVSYIETNSNQVTLLH